MTRNQEIGKWGEDAAVVYLEREGYAVVSRNIRTPHGEIDILVRRDDQWIFVEVKARTSRALGPPEIAVGARKQAHMVASAQYYAQQEGLHSWRIDVIAVERAGKEPRITHFENAIA